MSDDIRRSPFEHGPEDETLAGLSLSGRKPKGDPANYRRVEEVGKALNAKRMAMMGGGG